MQVRISAEHEEWDSSTGRRSLCRGTTRLWQVNLTNATYTYLPIRKKSGDFKLLTYSGNGRGRCCWWIHGHRCLPVLEKCILGIYHIISINISRSIYNYIFFWPQQSDVMSTTAVREDSQEHLWASKPEM